MGIIITERIPNSYGFFPSPCYITLDGFYSVTVKAEGKLQLAAVASFFPMRDGKIDDAKAGILGSKAQPFMQRSVAVELPDATQANKLSVRQCFRLLYDKLKSVYTTSVDDELAEEEKWVGRKRARVDVEDEALPAEASAVRAGGVGVVEDVTTELRGRPLEPDFTGATPL